MRGDDLAGGSVKDINSGVAGAVNKTAYDLAGGANVFHLVVNL